MVNAQTSYQADPADLARHSAPAWFRDAKFGIMITWGLFSVPAFAPRHGLITDLIKTRYDDALAHTPYAEWYENSMKFAGGETAAFHASAFPGRSYESFRIEFEAGLDNWSSDPWAELFAAAGARYVVPITRHADSFALWPSRLDNPFRRNWRAERDIIGEIAASVRARGQRFGVYYCAGQDWTFKPQAVKNLGEMIAAVPLGDAYRAYVEGHYRELIARYDPDLLWNDIAYPNAEDMWRLLAAYFNGGEDRAINDRFQPAGTLNAALAANPKALDEFNAALRSQLADPAMAFAPGEPPVYDFRTPEYASFSDSRDGPWECVRGIGRSFGYNANEAPEDRLGSPGLIRLLIDVVSKNGNLLLNVGPTGAGEIIAEEREALLGLGAWLQVNGAAIFSTRPWRRAEGTTACGKALRFTKKDGDLFALLLCGAESGHIVLRDTPGEIAALLGHGPIPAMRRGADLVVALPGGHASQIALAIALPGAAS